MFKQASRDTLVCRDPLVWSLRRELAELQARCLSDLQGGGVLPDVGVKGLFAIEGVGGDAPPAPEPARPPDTPSAGKSPFVGLACGHF